MILTPQNYHSQEANEQYMSYSQFTQFQKCEAAALAQIRGEYQPFRTSALLFGGYIDAYFSGELEQFKEENPEIFSSRGPTKGQLKSEFQHANTVIERIERDKFFMSYLMGDVQTILTGEIEGVPFKAKLDVFNGDRIVDMKIIRDFDDIWSAEERARVSWIRFWGYDIQAAIYRTLAGGDLPYYIAAATKETVPDIDVIELDPKVIEDRLVDIRYSSPRYQALKLGLGDPERCERCDYCKATKVLTEVTRYGAVEETAYTVRYDDRV